MTLILRRGDELDVHLHPGQSEAFESSARFVFVIAGTQSGKTSFGPFWLWNEIQKSGVAGDWIAASSTYDLFKLKMLPEMYNFFVNIYKWKWEASDRIITDGKSRIILRSANVPEALESLSGLGAWLDECGQDAFRLQSWEAVLRRVALSGGRVLGTTTPYNMGWLKTQIYDRWAAGDKDYHVVQFKSTMNPAFPKEEYERARRTLPPWKFNMFYNGEFSRPAGMIYADYDESIHKIRPFHLPPEWPRTVGVDFGAVNTALVWIAENPDTHCYYVYREYLEGGKSTPEHVEKIHALGHGENIVGYYGGAKSETQQRMDWGHAGLWVNEPPVWDVEGGIDRVVGLLRTKRLFFFDTLPGIMDEVGTYSRELDAQGQPTERIKDKETFHRLDALRYNVAGLAVGVQIF